MKITTCVPKQMFNLEEKFEFIERTIKKENSDIFITPQEYFGGWQYETISVTREDILPRLIEISKKYNCALVIGAVIEAKDIRQKLFFIENKLIGELDKFAIPGYALKGVGDYGITAENDYDNRYKTFNLKGLNVAGFFCWEVFSDMLIAGISVLEPDLVISAIKFGIAGYPKLEKINGLKKIVGVQHCGGDIWYERLEMASKFEFKCPIAISTNSWKVGSRYRPLAGVMFPYDEIYPIDADAVEEDVVVTNEINFEHTRGLREHKFTYLKRNKEFPDYKYSELTMLMKIHRMEQKLMGKTLQENIFDNIKKMRVKRKRLNKK